VDLATFKFYKKMLSAIKLLQIVFWRSIIVKSLE